VIAGATAVGGGVLTVVVDVDSVTLLEVESVIIGSTANAIELVNRIDVIIIFFMSIYFPYEIITYITYM
jgi:hypothetical protein